MEGESNISEKRHPASKWHCQARTRTTWLLVQGLTSTRSQLCLLIIKQSLKESLVAQMVKNLPAMQETQVRSLGQEDPLEEEMATHSGIVAWRIPWTEESDGLQVMGSQRVGHNWVTNTFTFKQWLASVLWDEWWWLFFLIISSSYLVHNFSINSPEEGGGT